jgi:DNA invertase Pin-like site-specific DNA recombinase
MKSDEPIIQTHPLITSDHLRRLAVVYIRQSSEQQVRDNVGSTEFQRGLMTVPRSYGWPDSKIQMMDEDLGITGSSSEARRGWRRLQMMMAAGEVGAVFCVTISRLSRRLLDFELFRQIAAENNTIIYTEGRFVDPNDSNDIVFSQLTAMLASHENRQRVRLMSQARITKAKHGEMVSVLPVGWLKGPDGYDYDPETKDIIQTIIDTFFQTRSIRRTVIALTKAGVQIPSRHGNQVLFKKADIERVRKILLHPAYCGVYVYGRTQSKPGGPILANGQSPRIKVPEERWIKHLNHHPAYMTQEQQEEIKSILSKNRWECRHRPGRGPAILQGLLRCAVCNNALGVTYNRLNTWTYMCGWNTEPCTLFTNCEFEKNVLARVFKLLAAPPLKMLQEALEETRRHERTHLDWIESERERLNLEMRKAQKLIERSYDKNDSVYDYAAEKFDAITKEQKQFEQKIKIAIEQAKATKLETHEELEELCRIASDVPTFWHYPGVSNQDRKEILRCLIDEILVKATRERIDATIVWKTGSQTSLAIWRGFGRYNLIRELHEQNLTVPEIRERLATGKNSTGQITVLCLGQIRAILSKLGLQPHRHSAEIRSLREKAAELSRGGRPYEWIAKEFNDHGFPSPSGKQWSRFMVEWLLHTAEKNSEPLEELHRRAILDALARGLDYQEMAVEFNERKLRRGNNYRQPWTAKYLSLRWCRLRQRQQKREQEQSANAALRQVAILRSQHEHGQGHRKLN